MHLLPGNNPMWQVLNRHFTDKETEAYRKLKCPSSDSWWVVEPETKHEAIWLLSPWLSAAALLTSPLVSAIPRPASGHQLKPVVFVQLLEAPLQVLALQSPLGPLSLPPSLGVPGAAPGRASRGAAPAPCGPGSAPPRPAGTRGSGAHVPPGRGRPGRAKMAAAAAAAATVGGGP